MLANNKARTKKSKSKDKTSDVFQPWKLVPPFLVPVFLALSHPNWLLINLIKLCRMEPPKQICGFCKENGERFEHYTSHRLRQGDRLVCPVLRGHKCEICGAWGDHAHTRSYCPRKVLLADKQKERMYNATILKETKFTAAGRRFQSKNNLIKLTFELN